MIEKKTKFISVGTKCKIFLQLTCCKNLYHQSWREHENNSQHQSKKVTQRKPINTYSSLISLFAKMYLDILQIIDRNKSLNNYVAVKFFHTLNTKNL